MPGQLSTRPFSEWGVKEVVIYYGDGSTAKIVFPLVSIDWTSLSSQDIQIIVIVYDEQYETWRDGGFVIRNYCDMLHGEDFYWFSPSGVAGKDRQSGIVYPAFRFKGFGKGEAPDRPQDAIGVKRGKFLESREFRVIFNRAYGDFS
jgi:hypothetical protein